MADAVTSDSPIPEFTSPVTKTYAPVPDAPISISDESSTTKILVRSDQPQFGVLFGTSASLEGALVCGTRPDEWLILGSPAATDTAAATVDTAGFTNVIGFTHGRSLFRVTGTPVAKMLEKVCGLDWSDPMTPNGAVVSASVALVTCDIIRDDVDGDRSYLLVADRSFAQYLLDAVLDAGAEFGISVL